MNATQLITSGLWGVLYYRELRGWPAIVWTAFAVWTTVGIVLLGQEKGS